MSKGGDAVVGRFRLGDLFLFPEKEIDLFPLGEGPKWKVER